MLKVNPEIKEAATTWMSGLRRVAGSKHVLVDGMRLLYTDAQHPIQRAERPRGSRTPANKIYVVFSRREDSPSAILGDISIHQDMHRDSDRNASSWICKPWRTPGARLRCTNCHGVLCRCGWRLWPRWCVPSSLAVVGGQMRLLVLVRLEPFARTQVGTSRSTS